MGGKGGTDLPDPHEGGTLAAGSKCIGRCQLCRENARGQELSHQGPVSLWYLGLLSSAISQLEMQLEIRTQS